MVFGYRPIRRIVPSVVAVMVGDSLDVLSLESYFDSCIYLRFRQTSLLSSVPWLAHWIPGGEFLNISSHSMEAHFLIKKTYQTPSGVLRREWDNRAGM